MSKRRFLYAIRDGFVNCTRHPLVIVASITTMMLLLLIGSSFAGFAINLRHLVEVAGQEPPIEIMFKTEINPAEAEIVDQQLENDDDVVFHSLNTPEENYEIFVDSMGKEDLFEDFEYEDRIPFTINVRLSDPALGENFRNKLLENPNIKDVFMEDEVMKLLNDLMRGVTTTSIIVMIVLGLITVFIISNMVRISVLARSHEINIMKYLGATNAYIRIPFLVQGLLVGLIGSLLSSVLFTIIYHTIYQHFGDDILNRASFALIPSMEIVPFIVLASILIGLFIGGLFSGLSVKKHVNV
ncbi:MAG: ABC transporter permease [Clostridiaceae bacterium]|nr:ABC transporter permease [Clostridiaceae bacterium]